MRTVASRIRCDPSAIHHAFGGRVGFRHEVVARFAARYANWLRGSHDSELVRMPLHADELHAVRVWAVLTELAAGEARAGRTEPLEAISAANAAEGDVLPWRLEMAPGDLSESARSALLAAARGARSAMADPVGPLPRSAALALVDAARAHFIQ